MKDIKFFLGKFFIFTALFISGTAGASGIDTLKSPADFYIASTGGQLSFDDAESYYLNAIEVYREKDCESFFLAQLYLVDFYRYKKNMHLSGRYLDTANILLETCPISDKYILSEYYKINGSVKNAVGENGKALESFSKAVYLLVQNGDTLPAAAMALFKKGWFLQSRLHYDSAGIYYEAAWRHLKSLYDKPNVYYLTILSGLADVYQTSVQLDKATKISEMLAQISVEHDIMTDYYVTETYITLGGIYYQKNELEKAELSYQYALNRLDDGHITDRTTMASVLYNLGLVNHYKGDYVEALNYYKKALNFIEGINPYTECAVLLNMADIFFKLDSIDKAAYYYTSTITKGRKYFGNKSTQMSKAYLAAADFHQQTSSGVDVLPMLKAAYNIYMEQDPDHPRSVRCRIELGNFYKNNQPDSSLYYYNEGLSVYPDLDELLQQDSHAFVVGHRIDYALLNLLQRKSILFFELAENTADTTDKITLLKQSLSIIDTSVQIYNKYINSFTLESSKLFISNDYKHLTIAAVMACRRLKDFTGDKAYTNHLYNYINRYKAAVLSSEIAAAAAIENADIHDTLFLLEKQYRNDITILQNYLYEQHSAGWDSPTANIAQRQLIELHKQHEKLLESLGRKYPEYVHLRYNQNVATVGEVQAALNGNECVIDYLDADTCLVSCFLDKHNFEVHFQSTGDDLQETVKQVSMLTRHPENISFSRARLIKYTEKLHFLYSTLFNSSMIDNKDALIIIPDAYLSELPFGILIKKLPVDLNSLGSLEYLIRHYHISYDYSAGLYVKHFNKEDKVIPRVAGFAPIYDYDTKENLPPLKASPQEVVDIGRYFDVKSFFRYQATEKSFREEQKDFSILHLAMHTSVDSANPGFSSLIFAPDTSSDRDHVLNASEIHNMQINAGLSVLSGCNSGYGKLNDSDGLLSLARAFYMAGSHSIVMNLWQVEDKVSKQIFDRFYFHLSNGYGRGEALRLAKLDFLKTADPRFHHPHYWGGFVLIGQKGTFLSNFGTRQIVLLAGVVLSVILVIIMIRAGIKRKSS